MATNTYMWFQDYQNNYLNSESQIDFSKEANRAITYPPAGKVFEVASYSFDIEQTLNIGSQSSGAGAGKVTFNPFSITRKVDISSPVLFQMTCSGAPFKFVTMVLRKATGTAAAAVYLRYTFKLVAVKTVSYAMSAGDDSPSEIVTLEYGGVIIEYWPQNADGTLKSVTPGGWNRVTNVVDQNIGTVIT